MKRIILTIAVIGILSVLVAPAMAGGGVHNNIILVSHPYYGKPHGGYNGGYYGGHYGNGYGYRAYYPPVYGYAPYVTRFPQPVIIYPPVVRPYYYCPRNSFYYDTPGFSIGVGF
jgi:hypothetical protein